MTARFGLKQLSTSARNSPFNSKDGQVLDLKPKSIGVPSLKIAENGQFKPVIPSPLATSPFFGDANKENGATQTKFIEKIDASSQTIVTVPKSVPTLSEHDLSSPLPTQNYYHVLVERLKNDLDEETERNQKLNNELADIREKINKLNTDLEILKEVIEEMKHDENDEDDDNATTTTASSSSQT